MVAREGGGCTRGSWRKGGGWEVVCFQWRFGFVLSKMFREGPGGAEAGRGTGGGGAEDGEGRRRDGRATGGGGERGDSGRQGGGGAGRVEVIEGEGGMFGGAGGRGGAWWGLCGW